MALLLNIQTKQVLGVYRDLEAKSPRLLPEAQGTSLVLLDNRFSADERRITDSVSNPLIALKRFLLRDKLTTLVTFKKFANSQDLDFDIISRAALKHSQVVLPVYEILDPHVSQTVLATKKTRYTKDIPIGFVYFVDPRPNLGDPVAYQADCDILTKQVKKYQNYYNDHAYVLAYYRTPDLSQETAISKTIYDYNLSSHGLQYPTMLDYAAKLFDDMQDTKLLHWRPAKTVDWAVLK